MKTSCNHPFSKMKKRKEFVRLAAVGEKVVTKSFVMQYAEREDTEVRVGYTASKKVGGAVQRNKAKRRMRALVGEHIRLNAESGMSRGYDIVFIARYSMVDRDFSKIQKDFQGAIQVLKA